MEVSIETIQRAVPITVVRLRGEFDAATAEKADERIDQVVESGAQYVLLDLAGIPFMSSTGIRTIYRLNNQLSPELSDEEEKEKARQLRDGTYRTPFVKILNPTSHVLTMMKMVGVDVFIDIFEDEEQALDSFTNVLG